MMSVYLSDFLAAESEVYRVHGPIFTELFITNYVDFKTENPQNYLIHFVAFDRNTFALSHNPSCSSSKSVIIYDYFNRPFVSLGSIPSHYFYCL